jgi:hypothetical protein
LPYTRATSDWYRYEYSKYPRTVMMSKEHQGETEESNRKFTRIL